MARTQRKTIRVFFANCPHLNEPACEYLILSQNRVQRVFEFEIHHASVYAEHASLGNYRTRLLSAWSGSALLPLQDAADRRYAARMDRLAIPPLAKEIPVNDCLGLLRPYVTKYDAWLQSLPVEYGNWALRQGPTIIVTETALSGGYLSTCGTDLALVTLAGWEKRYSPPSVLEYTLTQVQRFALRMAIDPRIGSHYPTRACAWDFTAHQRDARMGSLVGYLCDTCRGLVAQRTNAGELEQIEELLARRWIGRVDEPGSVAGNLTRAFGHDLTMTRGLSPTFFERVREHVPAQLVTLAGTALAALVGALATLLTLWLRTKLAK